MSTLVRPHKSKNANCFYLRCEKNTFESTWNWKQSEIHALKWPLGKAHTLIVPVKSGKTN